MDLWWLLAAGMASIPALRVFGRLSNTASRPAASTSIAKQARRGVSCTRARTLCFSVERNSQSYCSCTQAVGGQPCVIRAYVAEYLNYEFPYLFDRVLGGVLGACSCYLRVLPRAQLLHDTNISHALIVSGTNGDAWPSFAADMAATRGRADLKTLGLVHLGDEHLSDDVSGYPDFAFVLRNYLREDLPHGAQVPLFCHLNTPALPCTAQKVWSTGFPRACRLTPKQNGEQMHCHCGMAYMLVAHSKAGCCLFESINQSLHSSSLHIRRCTGCHWGMATCCCPGRRA